MTVAFIPVRGGSKSLPGKNIRPLAGRPLLHWAARAALDSPRIDRVFVSSDSDEILAVAASLGSPRLDPIRRAPELCTDTASTEAALLDFAARFEFDRVVLIQATSPLTRAEDFEGAFEHMDAVSADSLVSVTRERRFLWREVSAGIVEPKNYDPRERPRRQDWDGELVENGAFYISTREALLQSSCRVSGKVAYWEMPPETAVEIDEERDWRLLERLLLARAPIGTLAQKIRLLVTDVDGVLTDGGMYYGPDGELMKKFNTRDGQGFALLRDAGVDVAIVTRERSGAVAARARKLGIDEVHLGILDKLPVVTSIAERLGISLAEVAYIGDDIHDVETMERVGLAACPRDAQPAARAVAVFVCTRDGGAGCVRELAEHVLSARQR